MSLQIGTFDGLINITEDKINCFTEAIDAFSSEEIKKARELNISLGAAFQRFVEPVYKDPNLEFDIKSIENPVVTRNGKEQSPARVTFCRKMGLLNISDADDIFQLTPIGKMLNTGKITISEYAFILLSKQGIFQDGVFKDNLLSVIAEWFSSKSSISEDSFKKFVLEKYKESRIEKTRFDIILNALVCCGLLASMEKGQYVLADTNAAAILDFVASNKHSMRIAVIDDDDNYTNYIGSLSFGIFDIIGLDDRHLLDTKYTDLKLYITSGTDHSASPIDIEEYKIKFNKYILALRTKPFLLLAGISGTGKSRIVKQMAFDSCPDNPELRKDPTSPGNYCLIEVKPNWHDSTELLGYESQIGKPHYQLTPFVKFLAKAMLHPSVPFFVCLDEMNLAPVEQYFAEFLSVLESRKRIGDNITSEPLIEASVFKKYEDKLISEIFDIKDEVGEYQDSATSEVSSHYGKENAVYELLKKQGLRIPANVVVIGTVNMDETTHQFSRKVIDRAMTIEMNLPVDDPFMKFYDSKVPGYSVSPLDASLFFSTEVYATEALEELAKNNGDKIDWLKGEVAKILTELNVRLEDTPFKIAYRVQNELILYFYEQWRDESEPADLEKWQIILDNAVDQILMMKVLPRVEGDDTLLKEPLDRLEKFCEQYPASEKKIQEMKSRLERAQFTSYWP